MARPDWEGRLAVGGADAAEQQAAWAEIERLREENEELKERDKILLEIELSVRTERDNLRWLLRHEFKEKNPETPEPDWLTLAASLREAADEK